MRRTTSHGRWRRSAARGVDPWPAMRQKLVVPPLPSVRSFMMADHVFRQASEKWCLIGVFNEIAAPRFPIMHHSLGLFVEISDAEGENEVAIDFCNAGFQVLSPLRGIRIQVRVRLRSAYIGIQTYNLPIPAPGRYFFKLYFGKEAATVDIPIDVKQSG